MKNFKKLFSAFLLLSFIQLFAQAPQKISYQSVVRNATGNLVGNTVVGIKISLLQNSPTGTVVYSETHTPFTNENGLATLQIGGGNLLSGNFDAIDWGNGTYFVKTETDPNGGSNYSISATSQLLSVPYALYAARSGNNGGRTSIYLTGDITNSEAQTRLDEDLGPNTENIYIYNTTVLTAVNLNLVTSLANLKITGNAALSTINFNNLESVFDSVLIDSNQAISALNFPELKHLYGEVSISNNSVITLISMPNLNKLVKPFQINNNTVLTIDLSGLVEAKELKFTSLYLLNQLLLPNLTTAFFTLGGTYMTTFTLQNFVSGSVNFYWNSAMTSINLPNFTNAIARTGEIPIRVWSNNNLTTLTFPNLSSMTQSNGYKEAELTYNRFPSSQINEILNKMLSVTPVSGKYIILTNQYPNFNTGPTGQGIIDKQTLIAAGNVVYTD